MEFEWDPEKAALNLRRHRVAFAEAITVFSDPLSVTDSDPDHSDDETRFIVIGTSGRGTLMMVVHTARGSRIRIISARALTRAERVQYERGLF
ncbi:MAG: BrnT family toxin [Chloroflexi bacterium]|nr:BrnT family toxin [Chloroflexota bacterium]